MSIAISSPTMNLVTGKFNISATISTTTINTGTLRITAPDGLYYYSAGNNATTFTNGTGSDIAGVAGSYTNNIIDIPLDANGVVQAGLYKLDYNYKEGVPVLNYSGVLSSAGWTYCFEDPELSVSVSVNCDIPIAVFADATDYEVEDVIPTITGTMVLSKTNDTPTFTPVSTVVSGINTNYTLTGEFYAGYYTIVLTSNLTYAFTNHNVFTTLTLTDNALQVACDEDTCTLLCAYNTLKLNLDDTLTTNPKLYLQYIQKATLLNFYNGGYWAAVKCKDDTSKAAYIAKIQALIGFNSNCCGGDENYQIKSVSLCDCRQPVEAPELATSTTDSDGNAYVAGDIAYDQDYIYRYDAIGVWTRAQKQTW